MILSGIDVFEIRKLLGKLIAFIMKLAIVGAELIILALNSPSSSSRTKLLPSSDGT